MLLHQPLMYRFCHLGHQVKPSATGVLLPSDLFHGLLQIVFRALDVNQPKIINHDPYIETAVLTAIDHKLTPNSLPTSDCLTQP